MVKIRAKDIDTSTMYVGLEDDLPEIERKIRKLVAECIAGFLEDTVTVALERKKGRDTVCVYFDMGKGHKCVYQRPLSALQEQQEENRNADET